MKLPWLATLMLCLLAADARAADESQVVITTYPRDTENAGAGKRFVVLDPDAHGGNAQAALLDHSQPGWVIGSFYGYARPAGVYEITWRVKVKSNASDKVVFKAATNDNGGSGFKSGAIEVKGADFKAAGVYQDISHTAEKGESGFFAVQCYWGGQTDVSVDWCRIRSVKLYTEKELLERSEPLNLPAVWRLPPRTPLQLHVAKGLWWDLFQINDALAWRQGGAMQSSYLEHGQGGSSLRGFPGSATAITEHGVILLCNVDAPAIGARGRMLLEEYVRQGGSLFILGGRHAFTGGGYANTAIDRLLPCTFKSDDRQRQPDGLVITPTDLGKQRLPALPWEMKPRVFHYSRVTPREGAEVWLRAGDQPLLLAWKVGKGRVACWTGSVEGDPGAGRLAFWEWAGLAPIVDATLTWLIADQARPPEPFDPDADGKALGRLVTVSMENDAEAQTTAIVDQLVAKCNSPEFARRLINDLVPADAALDRASVNRLVTCARPFVDASWASLGQQLVAARRPGKVALGLRLLGLARGEFATAEIPKHLKETGNASMDALSDPSQIGAAERELIGALQAAGDLGDARNLEAVTRIANNLARQLPADGDTNVVADLREEAYQHALLARLKLGDGEAALPLVDAVLKNILAIEQYLNYIDMMLVTKDDTATIAGRRRAGLRLPMLHERQRALLQATADLPVTAIEPLAAALVQRQDAILLPFAFTAFAAKPGRTLDDAAMRGAITLVEKSRVPQMRLIGFRMLLAGGSDNATAKADKALGQLAASEQPDDAMIAVRQCVHLAPTHRAAVLKVALTHASPGVQRLARLMQATP